ncbi:SAC3/GANP/Nin1/mts3/eIF-3 p25 family-domain-containing protein [Infundibulicybe gibba]|nr:SAC3/GANP/Nin1/mts3/eIF-3 p25 family-domain-containing protein [Infundibulicybe gibba]
MDDPLIPKRLEDAISMVGTCQDMCPRFERYRRERENNLFEWETIPGTKRIDHKRAVKMYERAAGDKTLPSDLRPPTVLKRTLDYLFHDLLPRGGFSQTFSFIRDRSRAVRNDFTMQHNTGALAIECHDRCARFHILALHFERDRKDFSVALEEQQLMNTLQSLKEFYEDQRGRYESPTELEMRVYHRLIHIRDQRERHEGVPDNITSHPVFKLTTDFRLNVQRKSAPIGKATPLIVDAEGMEIFAQLASVLREQGSVVMIYLVACILERLFGKETIDDIEAIRGDLGIPDIIDGASSFEHAEAHYDMTGTNDYDEMVTEDEPEPEGPVSDVITAVAPRSEPSSIFNHISTPDSFPATSSLPPSVSSSGSAFSSLQTTPNVFGASTFSLSKTTELSFGHASVFGISNPAPAVAPIPSTQSATTTIFSLPEPRPQPSLKPPTPEAGDRNISMFGNGNGNISWSSNILAASQAPASQPVTETPPPVSSTLNAGAPSFTPTSHQPTSASQSISTFEPLTSTPVHPSDPSIPSHTITADQPAFTPRQSVTPTLPKIDTTTRTNSITHIPPVNPCGIKSS